MIKEKSKTWANLSIQLGRLFAKLPFPPNFYTWMTLPVAFLGLALMINGRIGWSIVCFIVAGIMDLIDGALARHWDCASGYGAFLDGTLDRFIDFTVIFGYFWLPLTFPWLSTGQWICLAIFFAIMPSYQVAYANHRGAVHDPQEKIIWRILNRGEMYALMLLIPLCSIYNSKWAGYLVMTLVALSALTTLQTLWKPLRLAKANRTNLTSH